MFDADGQVESNSARGTYEAALYALLHLEGHDLVPLPMCMLWFPESPNGLSFVLLEFVMIVSLPGPTD